MINQLLFILLLSLFKPVQDEYIIHVAAIEKNENAEGSKNNPVASINEAIKLAEEFTKENGYPKNGITILVAEGTYVLDETIKLDNKLSGSSKASMIIRAVEGTKPVISGGISLSPDVFSPVKDKNILESFINPDARKQVLVTNLKALGIEDYGQLLQHGFPMFDVHAPMELVFNNVFMTLAQWPNERKLQFDHIIEHGAAKRYDKESDKKPVFSFSYERPSKWKNTENIWLSGIFNKPWSPDFIQIDEINLKDKFISLTNHHWYGFQKNEYHDNFQVSTWYRFVNVLEELDMAGEWFIDRKKGLLYFWPPTKMEDDQIQLTSFNEAYMVSLNGTSNVLIEGLTFELSRRNGIEIIGGDHNVVQNCTIRNMGGSAIKIDSKDEINTQNGVHSCTIFGMGTRGIGLKGGDIQTLKPGGNFVENSQIFNCSRLIKTYTPAVQLSGVGNQVVHCEIHNFPQFGITFSGNEHIIEHNEFYQVALDFSDAGAIYSASGPLHRGTKIRYNFFHDIGLEREKVNAIYLDHGISGIEIFGNVFNNIRAKDNFGAIMFNGGNDNEVKNNLFTDCKTVMHVSNYLNGWGYNTLESFANSWGKDYESRNANEPPYSQYYPELGHFYEDNLRIPSRNKFVNNLSLNCEQIFRLRYDAIIIEKNNFNTRISSEALEKILKEKSLTEIDEWKEVMSEFQLIPFKNMGLYENEK